MGVCTAADATFNLTRHSNFASDNGIPLRNPFDVLVPNEVEIERQVREYQLVNIQGVAIFASRLG